jgi:hypothetical protein
MELPSLVGSTPDLESDWSGVEDADGTGDRDDTEGGAMPVVL